jgi:hypothetical protein
MEEKLKGLIGDQSILLIIGFLGLIFQNTIQKVISAIFVFFGNDYNEDDVILLNGRPARIVRVGLWKTTFFIYTIKDGKIVGGNKLVMQNEQLAGSVLEKPLPKIDLDNL